jgi:hypothetical protein
MELLTWFRLRRRCGVKTASDLVIAPRAQPVA